MSTCRRLSEAVCDRDLLFSYAVEGGLIVEAEIAGVDDVVGSGRFGKLIQRTEIAWEI
jgi:hypothetical protein